MYSRDCGLSNIMTATIKRIITLIICLIIVSHAAYAQANSAVQKPSIVEIIGQKGDWQLKVNGQPFYIKGVGCGEYLHEENIDQQLNWCKEIGANAIRRWGRSDYDSLILEKCKEYNLMALMGFWMPVTLDYVSDEYSKDALLARIEDYVNKYKDHPNLLMWGIGNEVIILGEMKFEEQDVELTDEEKEERRIEFAKYLQRVCKRIHEIDPNHPVVYAGAGLTALKYIKLYTPDLDIYGINFYGGAKIAYLEWKNKGADIPYMFTEFGPLGPWETEKDINDQPIEPTDQEKAESFRTVWRRYILGYMGHNLGGFAFHLTEKKLGVEGSSPTWWGLTYDEHKSASFWALREVYTGKKASNRPPVIKELRLSKISNLNPNESIKIIGKISDYENDPVKLKLKVFDTSSSSYLNQYSKNIKGMGKIELEAPQAEGIYRVFLFVTDNHGNITSANKSISVNY